jgi:hypothetical protein
MRYPRKTAGWLQPLLRSLCSGPISAGHAFWSLTMYDLPASLLVANPLKPLPAQLADAPQFKNDANGGLTLYIQKENLAPTRSQTGYRRRRAIPDVDALL